MVHDLLEFRKYRGLAATEPNDRVRIYVAARHHLFQRRQKRRRGPSRDRNRSAVRIGHAIVAVGIAGGMVADNDIVQQIRSISGPVLELPGGAFATGFRNLSAADGGEVRSLGRREFIDIDLAARAIASHRRRETRLHVSAAPDNAGRREIYHFLLAAGPEVRFFRPTHEVLCIVGRTRTRLAANRARQLQAFQSLLLTA